MVVSKNSLTERAQRCANTIVSCEHITADGMAVIIEAYKKDLQDILRNEPVIDNVMVQSTQTYFLDIGSNLDNKTTSNQIIITALEKLRVAFRETTKTHNINTRHEVMQIKSETPKPNEHEDTAEINSAEINSAHTPLIQKKKKIRKKMEFLPTPPPTPTEKSIPKPQPPAFEIPESYRTNSIFGSKQKAKSTNKTKSKNESLFDIKMRATSPSQQKTIKNNVPIILERTYITLTKEEKDQIKTIFNSEPFNEIRIRSNYGKIEEVKTIQKNYETVIMNYTEIMSIILNQNQTEKTEIQAAYIEKSRNILHELRNKFTMIKNSPHMFKASEQKNNSYEKINRVSKNIKLLVQFN